MKSLEWLLSFRTQLALELATQCGVNMRDIEADDLTVRRRAEDEGLSFLTITLSRFGSDFERSLDQGAITSDLFAGFQRRGGLPKLYSGFLRCIFTPQGALLNNASWEAVQAVRQLTLLFGKIKLELSEERNSAALTNYVETDRRIREQRLCPDVWADFRRVSHLLFHRGYGGACQGPLQRIEEELITEIPSKFKHGPGATQDRRRGNAKWSMGWTERLERELPYGECVLPSWSYASEYPVLLHSGAEPPVRVITVPKTAKTPRIIAIEPTHMQYAQQGLMAELVPALENAPLTKSILGFTDQEPNQRLAQLGSADGSLGTLDLSEASDRVSVRHVWELLAHAKSFRRAVFAARTQRADVLGEVLPLAKFASMGSALTFPLEAMVFVTVVFLGIERAEGRLLSSKRIYALRDVVRVYGDDLVVPTQYADSIAETLELYGFKVNAAKSFWTGGFRESCGKEYFRGHDVSIVRVRQMPPSDRRDVEEVISLFALRNNLYMMGLWNTVRWVENTIRELNVPAPVTLPTAGGLTRWSVVDYQVSRQCARLHRPLVKAMVPTKRDVSDPLTGTLALAKCFRHFGVDPLPVEHLNVTPTSGSVALKIRWITPY